MTDEKHSSTVHPGKVLADMLKEYRISQAQLARRIGVTPMCISHIVNGNRPVTAETACLLARAFGQNPRFWLNLQMGHDIIILQERLADRLEAIVPYAAGTGG